MKFFATIGVFVMALPMLFGLMILSIMWRTWWFYPAWGWFIVPLGARPITFWHFAGLTSLLSIMTTKIDTKEDNHKEIWTSWVVVFVWPILAWALLRWLAS